MNGDVFFINGRYMVQLPSTPKSGLFRFKDIEDASIYKFELNEIPKHYHSLLEIPESDDRTTLAEFYDKL